ncbi:MAG: outer membrane protein transport protein [Moraxellaceae bacterium]|nr:outer membrane protein transport protein [Moraxellaceae bacterium]
MKMLPKTLALMIAVASGSAWSAGFALNEQSIKSMGMAQAGRASAAADATTLFGNPAGMTQLEGTNLSGNATFIYVPTDIENVQGSQAGTNNGDMIPPTWVGSGFISHQMSDDLSIGIGNFAPFGLASNYESSFQGRYFGDKSKVKVIGIQPTIAYKLTPELSIGVGVSVSQLEGTLSKYSVGLQDPVEVNGDDISYGYNVGVLWQVMPQTRIGFDYRSKTEYSLEGTTELTGIGVKFPATLDISTPATFELSLSHALNPNVNVHSSISLTQWSVLENLVIKNGGGASGPFKSSTEELDWKDSWAYSVGADWKAGDALTLRAGLGIDKTPVSDAHRSVRVPSEDRMVATLGLSYPINDSTSIDVAYMFLKEDTAHVDVSKTTPAGPVTYSADYKGMGHLIGAQLNMKF